MGGFFMCSLRVTQTVQDEGKFFDSFISPRSLLEKQLYTQKNFDEENSLFERAYSQGREWTVKKYFSRFVYLNKLPSPIKPEQPVENRVDVIQKDLFQRIGDIFYTNVSIKVLNVSLRDPLRTFEDNPKDSKIYEIYVNIIGSLPDSFAQIEEMQLFRVFVVRNATRFYQKELSVFIEWMRRTKRANTPREAVTTLFNKDNASFVNALAYKVLCQTEQYISKD